MCVLALKKMSSISWRLNKVPCVLSSGSGIFYVGTGLRSKFITHSHITVLRAFHVWIVCHFTSAQMLQKHLIGCKLLWDSFMVFYKSKLFLPFCSCQYLKKSLLFPLFRFNIFIWSNAWLTWNCPSCSLFTNVVYVCLLNWTVSDVQDTEKWDFY